MGVTTLGIHDRSEVTVMRKCKCGNDVARNAKFCPKCGKRFTSSPVKFLAGLCVVLLVVVILGAITASNSPQSAVSASPSMTAPTPAPVKPKTSAEMTALRKEYASLIDKQLLNMGIESETYTVGPQAKTLVIKDALAGRVRQNAIQQNGDMFENLKLLKFSRLEYTNGFDGDLNFDVYWTIKP
jgi:hypothetical protein